MAYGNSGLRTINTYFRQYSCNNDYLITVITDRVQVYYNASSHLFTSSALSYEQTPWGIPANRHRSENSTVNSLLQKLNNRKSQHYSAGRSPGACNRNRINRANLYKL